MVMDIDRAGGSIENRAEMEFSNMVDAYEAYLDAIEDEINRNRTEWEHVVLDAFDDIYEDLSSRVRREHDIFDDEEIVEAIKNIFDDVLRQR